MEFNYGAQLKQLIQIKYKSFNQRSKEFYQKLPIT